MFIHELENLLEVPRAKIFLLEKELNLHPVETKIHSTISFLFSDEEDKKIIEYFKNEKEKARIKKEEEIKAKREAFQLQLIELKKEHPLVTDDRCFKLSWFPDIVPDCFKEVNNEN